MKECSMQNKAILNITIIKTCNQLKTWWRFCEVWGLCFYVGGAIINWVRSDCERHNRIILKTCKTSRFVCLFILPYLWGGVGQIHWGLRKSYKLKLIPWNTHGSKIESLTTYGPSFLLFTPIHSYYLHQFIISKLIHYCEVIHLI